jgi:hypothetical protein
VIIDPSVLFTEEIVEWLSNARLRRSLFVSEALWQRLENPDGGEQFIPYGANPGPNEIRRIRAAFAENRFSYHDAVDLPEGARGVCEELLAGEAPLGDVLADEWAFVTSQSLAVLAEGTQATLDAFRKSGGQVFTVGEREMERGLNAIRRKLPPRLLKIMKVAGRFPRRRLPKLLVVGGSFALGLLPHVGLSVGVASLIQEGVAVIAGDP